MIELGVQPGGHVRSFGELEAAVMDRLWSYGRPATVRDVVADLDADRRAAYTTVMTVMERLHRKGWLRRKMRGRAWLYEPAASREEYTAQLMQDALGTAADRTAALAHFARQIPAEDAAVLRDALRRLRPRDTRPE